jgi:hypothetical protein
MLAWLFVDELRPSAAVTLRNQAIRHTLAELFITKHW